MAYLRSRPEARHPGSTQKWFMNTETGWLSTIGIGALFRELFEVIWKLFLLLTRTGPIVSNKEKQKKPLHLSLPSSVADLPQIERLLTMKTVAQTFRRCHISLAKRDNFPLSTGAESLNYGYSKIFRYFEYEYKEPWCIILGEVLTNASGLPMLINLSIIGI